MPDYYKILNLHKGATLNEIKVSYRKLAKKYHPDLNQSKGPEMENAFKTINHAYHVLSDEKRREEYDRTLGIRNTNWSPKSRPFDPHQPPSGFKTRTTYSSGTSTGVAPDASIYNERVWRAWHYGDDAIVRKAVRQVDKDPGPMSKQDKYFARMQEKDRKEAQEMREAARRRQQEITNSAAANLQARREERRQQQSKPSRNSGECVIS